jgi:hypothetical protein
MNAVFVPNYLSKNAEAGHAPGITVGAKDNVLPLSRQRRRGDRDRVRRRQRDRRG